jgi:hypothetical protein
MKPSFSKLNKALNIVIYAQSGILAGDLAALLSGHNTVDRQTSLPEVLTTLNDKTDVLLLVGGGLQSPLPDPAPALLAAKKVHCKVIMLGEWPGYKQKQLLEKDLGFVTTFTEIPSPAALFEIIGSKTKS